MNEPLVEGQGANLPLPICCAAERWEVYGNVGTVPKCLAPKVEMNASPPNTDLSRVERQ